MSQLPQLAQLYQVSRAISSILPVPELWIKYFKCLSCTKSVADPDVQIMVGEGGGGGTHRSLPWIRHEYAKVTSQRSQKS